MKILITGASGTVGIETIKKILVSYPNAGVTVFDLPSKKNKNILNKFSNSIKIVYGNIINYEVVEKVCAEKDFIIHLAAIIPPLADELPQLAYNVNVIGTENIIKAIKNISPKTKLIYSSSISVYGDRISNPMIKVEDLLTPSDRDEYAKTKIQAEELIQQSGIDWTIFRLSAIFGYNNHKISKIMFHMPLNTPIEITTAEDTGRAFANAINNFEKLNKRIFNLGGGENCRIEYRKFLSTSFNLYGLGKVKFPGLAFATHNFHCAYYADGIDLENILHFRKDTIDTYFKNVGKKVQPSKKFFSKIFSNVVQSSLLKKSEPYRAVKKGITVDITHYFSEKMIKYFVF